MRIRSGRVLSGIAEVGEPPITGILKAYLLVQVRIYTQASLNLPEART